MKMEIQNHSDHQTVRVTLEASDLQVTVPLSHPVQNSLRSAAAEMERKAARLQRRANFLRQAASLLED